MFHVKQQGTLRLPLADDTALQLQQHAELQEHASPTQHITVTSTPRFGKLYLINGDAMAAEADEFIIHESLAHIVALAHPTPKRALILGGGDGGSARELLKHPTIEHITVAELDPTVIAVVRAELPSIPAGAFDNPRVHIHPGDAADTLRTLHAAGQRFDLILFDLTASDDPACAHLHGDAFLALCAASLRPRGLIHVQLGSPFYAPEKVRKLWRRLRTIMPSATPRLIDLPLYGGPWLLASAGAGRPATQTEATLAARLVERRITGLRYYNPALHLASAALPNYMRDLLA